MWSLSVSSDHLFEGKSRSHFLWQLGRRVICNLLYFQASWLFCVAMFLKSRKLCLAHSGDAWNGKDFGPNSVAWVGFKSLSGMSSLEPGICNLASVVTDEISEIESSGRGVNYKLLAHRAIGTVLILETSWPRFLKISPWFSVSLCRVWNICINLFFFCKFFFPNFFLIGV